MNNPKQRSVQETNGTPIVITSSKERRTIHKIDTTLFRLKNLIFGEYNPKYSPISFNIMMITSDHKVLLLQRSNSFYFNLVKKHLKNNKDLKQGWTDGLYSSEIKQINMLYPNAKIRSEGINPIYIFPGGHSHKKENIITTLLREFREETSIKFSLFDLNFCCYTDNLSREFDKKYTFIFHVEIFDFLTNLTYNNIIFPIQINFTSSEFLEKFNETMDTRNPIFIPYPIGRKMEKNYHFQFENSDLFEWFNLIQKFMLIK